MKRSLLFPIIVIVAVIAVVFFFLSKQPERQQAPAEKMACGEVTITEMDWASSQIVTEVAKFFIENGYGCTVKKIPTSTTLAVTSLAETGKPDIATEIWQNSTAVFSELVEQGKVKTLAKVFETGGEEGWWIPAYLAKKHPELKTIEGVLANPELVGGKFHNCPVGWGCRITNDNLIQAFNFKKHDMEVFNHGSGETLAASIGSAFSAKEPWFGYYWGPTAILGKYPLVKVDLGPYNAKAHSCNMSKDCVTPGKSSYPAAPVLTAVTTSFANSYPQVAQFLSKMAFPNAVMSELLAWKSDNKANAEEAAAHFIANHKDTWQPWLDANASKKLSNIR